mmetsp:Transcript_28776/g.81038  ORF Transcript_28776/g.81038 Transcript_28776/m.81038 type:complete len:228 (+) Transcript_28776:140-823(+)|eukprot:CAMPEP_0117675658 /NCGR_PEP_ID=MMETSP0804-20121206/15732_1 /TAXON_ID=1074897 /ORGANISM="Tetraselmis astigmatica, Strain CCMP880" /LENGTH=227 /DNA_ID=CAMNT_0005484695 /DNA_START=113 /DNA_END=796 /DNA_ORIENTATION=-
MSRTQDPYYLVREEIQESLTALEKSYDRLCGLPSAIPEFQRLKHEVQEGCESVSWQVDQLQRAIDISAKNPERFNLDNEELDSRKNWASSARLKVEEVRRGMASLAKRGLTAADSNAAVAIQRHDDFIGGQGDQQMQIMRQQDDDLDDLSHQVATIGNIGLTIHEELESQNQLLEELDEDMDATQSRLAAVQQKINKVLQRVSAKGQMCIIVALSVILVVLVVFTFT